MKRGKVKVWKDEKGFGFIEFPGSDNDVFFHFSGCKFDTRTHRPQPGDEVTFELEQSDRGPKAINVQLVDGEGMSQEEQEEDMDMAA